MPCWLSKIVRSSSNVRPSGSRQTVHPLAPEGAVAIADESIREEFGVSSAVESAEVADGGRG